MFQQGLLHRNWFSVEPYNNVKIGTRKECEYPHVWGPCYTALKLLVSTINIIYDYDLLFQNPRIFNLIIITAIKFKLKQYHS